MLSQPSTETCSLAPVPLTLLAQSLLLGIKD